jgi:serine/threonine protein kinase
LKPENALVSLPPKSIAPTEFLNTSAATQGADALVSRPPVLEDDCFEDAVEYDIYSDPSAIYKIVDLGNSCYLDRHFSEDIQTRQYRAPEVLLHAGYDTKADMWSLACMVFELVTGDYLFDPKGTEEFPRDEDHLALVIELFGPIPRSMVDRGKEKHKYYNRKYQLRHIKDLKRWPLRDVLVEKYGLEQGAAKELSEFLLPMLTIEPAKRASAEEMLKHKWLRRGEESTQCSSLEEPSSKNKTK